MRKIFSLFYSIFVFSISLIAVFITNRRISAFFNHYLIGSSSLFLYKYSSNYFFLAIKIAILLILSLTKYKCILLSPFLLIHIITKGYDFVFLLPLIFAIQSKNANIRTIIFMITAILRQLLIEPIPSIGLMWLIDSHQITDFHDITRIIIAFFQLFLIFISRYVKEDLFPVSVIVLFDPAVDFSLLAFILYFSFQYFKGYKAIQIAYSFLFVGFIFNQSSFYSWFKMNIGNPNFTMVGSILASIAFGIIMFFDKNQNIKQKQE